MTDRESEVLALLAEGLTNREIAQRLVLSTETVKWYNKQIYQKLGVGRRTEAVAVARRYGLLAAEEETAGAKAKDAALDTEAQGAGDDALPPLPAPLTSFVGREREIKQIDQMLRSRRLLTLTGPGGTGKTRLALKVAEHLRVAYDDGVAFVDLAAVEESAQVGPAMVRTLGLQEGQPSQEALLRFLRPRQMLLILDNFEHVIEAAPLVGELLEAAPRLSVLATSRQPLRVHGEQEVQVTPLPVPDEATGADVDSLTANDAVRLFLLRAQAVRPDFSLTEDNAGAVAAICRRLEGLPLAIELAAVQLKLFTPSALLARLEDRLATLIRGARDLPARQQTLRATIDWSHELLESEERILFRRLSVFRGGGTLEAVEAVCAQRVQGSALALFAALLDMSLIRQQEDDVGNVRLSMLETIREYAVEKLAAAGEVEAVRLEHARYFLAWVQQAWEDLRAGPRQFLWVRRIMTDYENVRAALVWLFRSGQEEMGARMVGALGHFWFRSGLHGEGVRWTERALEAVEHVPAPVQARVFSAAGLLAWGRRERERGRRYDERALALYREMGDERNAAWVHVHLAAQSIGQEGGYGDVGPLCREAVMILRELDDQAGLAQALNVLGELARVDKEDELARGYYEEALAIARGTGDRLRELLQLQNLGYLAQRAGDNKEAERLFRAGLLAAREVESHFVLAYSLMALAGAYIRTRPERAARLIGIAERHFEELGARAQPGDRDIFEGNRRGAREELGEETFAAALARGREMTLQEAVAYALEGSAAK